MKRTLQTTLLIAATLALTSTGAFAHDDATLDKIKAPNSGQLRMAGPYHFELVVAKDSKESKDNPVVVYLTDHGETKIPATGTTGTATLLSGKSKITVPLVPAGDNKLTGIGKYVSDPQMKVIVALTFADKKSEQARFTPLAVTASNGHGDHKH